MRQREQRGCLGFQPPLPATLDHPHDSDAAREHKRYGACKACVTTVGNLYEALCQTTDRNRLSERMEELAESTPRPADRWLSSRNRYTSGSVRTRLVSIDRALRSLERRGRVQRFGIYKKRDYIDGKGRWVLAWVTHWHRALQSDVVQQAQSRSIDAADVDSPGGR
jgi:carbamoylphosphate synthase large subunit